MYLYWCKNHSGHYHNIYISAHRLFNYFYNYFWWVFSILFYPKLPKIYSNLNTLNYSILLGTRLCILSTQSNSTLNLNYNYSNLMYSNYSSYPDSKVYILHRRCCSLQDAAIAIVWMEYFWVLDSLYFLFSSRTNRWTLPFQNRIPYLNAYIITLFQLLKSFMVA